MIGYLRGVPLALRLDSVLLDVGGVGYALGISLSTYYELERAGSDSVGLHVHTHLREGELALFGFWTEREKLLFEKLITVSGVGPRLARGILSGLPADDLVGALRAGDPVRLTRIPGIGRRTAERLVVELRERLDDLGGEESPVTGTFDADRDVISALTNLGYKPAAAERAVAELRRENPELTFQELLRLALQRLARL
ncbi:MAG TPA: Holliday junction branch migration protein RuvA [Thermoanaerobaculia bacterium]|nr:Holliday junction branch migration protein RuvA [Thermoanaerobaculia bacterium]